MCEKDVIYKAAEAYEEGKPLDHIEEMLLQEYNVADVVEIIDTLRDYSSPSEFEGYQRFLSIAGLVLGRSFISKVSCDEWYVP